MTEEIRKLDTIDDTLGLEDTEIADRIRLMEQLSISLNRKEAELIQKAKDRWAKEGDVNSALFHKMINNWISGNKIEGLWSHGTWLDSVKEVKETTFKFFKTHYKETCWSRPKLPQAFFTKSEDVIARREPYESLWWRYVKKLFWGSNGTGFRRDFKKAIGNGNKTSFWNEEWSEEDYFRCRFPRLYKLSLQKFSNIGDMGNWDNGTWVWEWKWSCTFSHRNLSFFNNMLQIVNRLNLEQHREDEWLWRPGKDGRYSTSKSFHKLADLEDNLDTNRNSRIFGSLWKVLRSEKL
ncbi:hypothetical protein ACS0TY_014577 [Phlomoides rotata]